MVNNNYTQGEYTKWVHSVELLNSSGMLWCVAGLLGLEDDGPISKCQVLFSNDGPG
jgi:hypothetical protein